MSKINYLCVDDAGDLTIQPLLSGLTIKEKSLQFERVSPLEFSAQVKLVQEKKPNGIILDLRLDEKANEAGDRVDYRGLSVAQELRTRMTENRMESVPIVLWSVFKKFSVSYRDDLTAHDLFDTVYDKDEDVVSDPSRVAKELVALHAAYLKIGKPARTRASITSLLALTQEEHEGLDPRFGDFLGDSKKAPTHEIARYILQDLVQPMGPLIDERHLAARLGVDIKESADWEKLKSAIKDACRYEGLYASGWERWWCFKLMKWWHSLPESPGGLLKLDAKDRVAILKKSLKLSKLKAALPIEANYSSSFSTVCRALDLPLDPVDGIRIAVQNSRPFQDSQYVSTKAALERLHITRGLSIDSLERSRLEQIKNVKKADKRKISK